MAMLCFVHSLLALATFVRADPIPVLHDRLIRRCDNHSTYYGTVRSPESTSGSSGQPQWSGPSGSGWPSGVAATSLSFSLSCGGYGSPCVHSFGPTGTAPSGSSNTSAISGTGSPSFVLSNNTSASPSSSSVAAISTDSFALSEILPTSSASSGAGSSNSTMAPGSETTASAYTVVISGNSSMNLNFTSTINGTSATVGTAPQSSNTGFVSPAAGWNGSRSCSGYECFPSSTGSITGPSGALTGWSPSPWVSGSNTGFPIPTNSSQNLTAAATSSELGTWWSSTVGPPITASAPSPGNSVSPGETSSGLWPNTTTVSDVNASPTSTETGSNWNTTTYAEGPDATNYPFSNSSSWPSKMTVGAVTGNASPLSSLWPSNMSDNWTSGPVTGNASPSSSSASSNATESTNLASASATQTLSNSSTSFSASGPVTATGSSSSSAIGVPAEATTTVSGLPSSTSVMGPSWNASSGSPVGSSLGQTGTGTGSWFMTGTSPLSTAGTGSWFMTGTSLLSAAGTFLSNSSSIAVTSTTSPTPILSLQITITTNGSTIISTTDCLDGLTTDQNGRTVIIPTTSGTGPTPTSNLTFTGVPPGPGVTGPSSPSGTAASPPQVSVDSSGTSSSHDTVVAATSTSSNSAGNGTGQVTSSSGSGSPTVTGLVSTACVYATANGKYSAGEAFDCSLLATATDWIPLAGTGTLTGMATTLSKSTVSMSVSRDGWGPKVSVKQGYSGGIGRARGGRVRKEKRSVRLVELRERMEMMDSAEEVA